MATFLRQKNEQDLILHSNWQSNLILQWQ